MGTILDLIKAINSLNIGIVVVMTLIALASKELVMSKSTKLQVNLGKYLNIPIVIMVALFLYLLARAVIEVLRIAS